MERGQGRLHGRESGKSGKAERGKTRERPGIEGREEVREKGRGGLGSSGVGRRGQVRRRKESRVGPEALREQAEMGEAWPSPRKEMAPEAWQLLQLIPHGGACSGVRRVFSVTW